MESIIHAVLSNFWLTFLIIGFIVSVITLLRAPKPLTAPVVVEALFSYFLLFGIGFACLYNFVMHTFFGEMSAKFIGWEDSPFQQEVGFASLGFALVGFLAFRRSFDLRLAAVIGPSAFLLGAAGVHIYEMVTAHNFAPGNAGVIFYTDILVPALGFLFLWLQRRHERHPAAA
jgi:hypothetical protein